MSKDSKVLCETPTEGKQGTRIDAWKYEAVRRAILSAVDEDPTGVEFRTLPERVRDRLSAEELQRLGSVTWYTTTVKLHLEVVGEIERIEASNPQRLRRSGS